MVTAPASGFIYNSVLSQMVSLSLAAECRLSLRRQRKPAVARIRYLSVAEAGRLINACDPGFRPLVRAHASLVCNCGHDP